MSQYGDIRKADLFSHLCEKRVFPSSSGYYDIAKHGIFELLGLDENNVPNHVKDRVSLEALHFSKKACQNWPKANSAKKFLDRFSKSGGFLTNYIRVPGPYKVKRDVVVPPKKQKIKKKTRKRKSFHEKCDRSHRNDSKKVKEAAFGDLDLLMYTAANLAIDQKKTDLGFVLKKMNKHPDLAKQFKQEYPKIQQKIRKGIGIYILHLNLLYF